MDYSKGPQPLGGGPLLVRGLLGTRPCSRRGAAGQRGSPTARITAWTILPANPVRGKIVLHETGVWCQRGWGPLDYRIIAFCCLIWTIGGQEKHKNASVTSELHFSQGCRRAGNKEKGCIFERIKPPYYSITQNSCCYSFLQENSRRCQYRLGKTMKTFWSPVFKAKNKLQECEEMSP